jgi:hypothetical protein
MPLSRFHPLIAEWFHRQVGQPTAVHVQAWPAIQSGADVLIAAPTGSGKTFAAFLSCIDYLFKQALAHELNDHTQMLYVSPLKALGNDRQKNLRKRLAEIGLVVLQAGLPMPELRITCGLDRCGSPYLLWLRMLRPFSLARIPTPNILIVHQLLVEGRRLKLIEAPIRLSGPTHDFCFRHPIAQHLKRFQLSLPCADRWSRHLPDAHEPNAQYPHRHRVLHKPAILWNGYRFIESPAKDRSVTGLPCQIR